MHETPGPTEPVESEKLSYLSHKPGATQDQKEEKIERTGKGRIVRLRRPRIERSGLEGQDREAPAADVGSQILRRVSL